MKILFKGKDDSVAIMILAPGANQEDAIKKFREAHGDFYVGEHIETETDLPEDRNFRNAWKIHQGKVVIDEHRAKNIHLDRIREVRDRELEKLDKEHLKYLTDQWKVKEIDEKKQALRDIPQNYVNFDIKNPKWPDELPRQ